LYYVIETTPKCRKDITPETIAGLYEYFKSLGWDGYITFRIEAPVNAFAVGERIDILFIRSM